MNVNVKIVTLRVLKYGKLNNPRLDRLKYDHEKRKVFNQSIPKSISEQKSIRSISQHIGKEKRQ